MIKWSDQESDAEQHNWQRPPVSCPMLPYLISPGISLDGGVPGPECINAILCLFASWLGQPRALPARPHSPYTSMKLITNPSGRRVNYFSPGRERSQKLRCASVKLSITDWHQTRRRLEHQRIKHKHLNLISSLIDGHIDSRRKIHSRLLNIWQPRVIRLHSGDIKLTTTA